ncbi:hypothetical protein AVEN_134118-1 [Araneus ventricosus]|uniref:Uncharacterized protein n=1 Tax=Araneus ventricosus TaxID=182803 RepID=A0A4Y2U3C3_ARAVE|nr:hypothetical protein AVEN_134118-1 [Araneus ventricosus]
MKFTCNGDRQICRIGSSTARNRDMLVTTHFHRGRRGKVSDVYASRLITDATGIWFTLRDTALRTPLSSCNRICGNNPFCAKKLDNCSPSSLEAIGLARY